MGGATATPGHAWMSWRRREREEVCAGAAN